MTRRTGTAAEQSVAIEIAAPEEDGLLADFYHRHWLDMGLPAEEVAPDWRAQALDFIAAARRENGFTGFVARRAGQPLGGACCHHVARAYPRFRASDAARTGYVWGLYVVPACRGRGIGTALVRACLDHLAAQGCGRVLLHSGDRSRPVYERLGFAATGELAITPRVPG